MICPICNRDVQIYPQTEMPCECCKSIIYVNEKSEVKIIKNKVSFAWDNFIFGILTIAGVIISFFYFKKYESAIVILGFGYLLGPILGLLQHLIFFKSNDFKNFTDLHKAIINGRLKYYDFGSKLLVFSLFITQMFGIGLLLFELIK